MGEKDMKMEVQRSDYKLEEVPLGFPFVKTSIEKCMEFEFDKDDVLLAGYPKSGNTWLTEILWLIMNDVDTEKASKTPVMMRAPLIDMAMPGKTPFVDEMAATDPPRIMNTHLPHFLLKDALDKSTPKTIVIFRNPKDVVVSYWHFYNTRPGRQIPEFNDFYDKFIKSDVIFGSWFEHTKGWWEKKDDTSYCFTSYEDFKLDHFGSVEKLVKFLGKDFSREQIQKIVDYTTFSAMKDNTKGKIVNDKTSPQDKTAGKKVGETGFFRKGIIGDWKNTLSEAQSEEIETKVNEILGTSGPNLVYEQ